MIENNNEAWDILNKILDKIQSSAKYRKILGLSLITILIALTAFFIYGLLPGEGSSGGGS
jgi:hypothetical protein